MPAIALLGLNLMQRGDECVDILVRVVECERWAHRRLQSEPSQDRLRAMMTGPDCDAFTVERGADILAAAAIEHEGDHPGFFLRRSDDGEARHAIQPQRRIIKQPMLVAAILAMPIRSR